MTKKEAQDLRAILASCPQSPKIKLATTIVDKQIAYFDAMKGQLKETWDEPSWWL